MTNYEEIKLNKKGYKAVAGIDEAGRGPLAGPVVASAVLITDWNFNKELLLNIKDSKKLSEKKREYLFEIILATEQIKWGIGIINEKKIDEVNIFQATKLAMIEAIENLKIKKCPDFLIIDGNSTINFKTKQKAIVKADDKVFSCSTASIIAKVTRDRIMCEYAKKYPEYQFEKHKGYGTKIHIEAIKKFGPCNIHRKTFKPISYYFQEL
ncbi:MAG: ribonuclease HII [Candidatus Pacebacteria bacterium]|nr:ribonuclease HII [Candidatus Paceibacterota bacterium]